MSQTAAYLLLDLPCCLIQTVFHLCSVLLDRA